MSLFSSSRLLHEPHSRCCTTEAHQASNDAERHRSQSSALIVPCSPELSRAPLSTMPLPLSPTESLTRHFATWPPASSMSLTVPQPETLQPSDDAERYRRQSSAWTFCCSPELIRVPYRRLHSSLAPYEAVMPDRTTSPASILFSSFTATDHARPHATEATEPQNGAFDIRASQ